MLNKLSGVTQPYTGLCRQHNSNEEAYKKDKNKNILNIPQKNDKSNQQQYTIPVLQNHFSTSTGGASELARLAGCPVRSGLCLRVRGGGRVEELLHRRDGGDEADVAVAGGGPEVGHAAPTRVQHPEHGGTVGRHTLRVDVELGYTHIHARTHTRADTHTHRLRYTVDKIR